MAKKIQNQEDYVSSAKAREIMENLIKHEDTRVHIRSVVEEYANSVPFMDKVRKYASQEIDSRLFKTLSFYVALAVTSAVTVAINLAVARLLD